jgi:adenylate cyclase
MSLLLISSRPTTVTDAHFDRTKSKKPLTFYGYREVMKMGNSILQPYRLAAELSQIFNLERNIDNVLAVAMYKLSQIVNAERSSIFLVNPIRKELTSFASLDLSKHEICMSTSSGVAGWVFENRKPAIVNKAYDDCRFYDRVDFMTGFRTRNLICAPLIDCENKCCGTLQVLNKKRGDFTTGNLELLILAAGLMAVALNNCRLYNKVQYANRTRKKLCRESACHLN